MNHRNSIIDADKVKEKALNLYDLNEPLKCSFIRRSFNDHYLIENEYGRYIVRVYLNDKYYIEDVNDINFELDFLTFLKSRNVCVSYPIKNLKGEYLTPIEVTGERKYMTLLSYADGYPLEDNLTDDTALRLGEIIAQIHIQSDDFDSDKKRYKIDTGYLIDEPIELLKELSIKYSLKLPDSVYQFVLDMKVMLDEIPCNDDTFGLIHADLNPSNIHVDESGKVTVFDFDHCAIGYRIHDLAVVKLCYDERSFNSVMNSYKERRNISDIEERLIDVYSKALLLRKYKDVISMERICCYEENLHFNEKDYVKNAIETLEGLIS